MNDDFIVPEGGCEYDFAVAVMNGAPPVHVFNVVYVAYRLTTTGVAVRDGRLTLRDPKVWLSDQMCRRVIGTRVMAAYGRVGGLCIGFVKDGELWAVAKLYFLDLPLDRLDVEMNIIDGPQASVPLPNGKLIVEGSPRLIDYLALVTKDPK